MSSKVQDILGAVRSVAAEQIASQAAQVDRRRMFPTEGMAALAAIGGLGIAVSEEYGGAGGGLLALSEACEAVGSACASTGMVFLMHAVTAATIAGGGGERAAEYLEGFACRADRRARSLSASAARARTSMRPSCRLCRATAASRSLGARAS